MNRRLYWSALGLYAVAYALPATMMSGKITGWGWQAALLSVAPLIMWLDHPVTNWDMGLLALLVSPSNLAFIAAAILLPLGKRRTALACALVALASMIYIGFITPMYSSDLIRTPAGHLGPGYYVWVLSGALMVWTAFSSRSAA